jgi:hypothetical protein
MQTLAQFKKQMTEEKRTPAPWLKPDKSNPQTLTFRFLDLMEDMPFVRSHYDPRINRAVQCNRTMFEKKDGSYGFAGQCDYCDLRRAFKLAFKPSPGKTYADKDWDMSCSLVSRVAVLNSDGTQTFKLLNLKAKDLPYTSGKGFYKALESFTVNKAKAKKPSLLTDYWWELNPDWTLMSSEKCDEDQLSAEIKDFITDDVEYSVNNVAPMKYVEALRKVAELEKKNEDVVDYPDEADGSLQEEGYDDETPPFS